LNAIFQIAKWAERAAVLADVVAKMRAKAFGSE
jgi:hypothetical protein